MMALEKTQADEEFERLKNDVAVTHKEMGPTIQMLVQINQLREENYRYLSSIIKGTKRRFDQARTTSEVVIRDQNALQASEIDSINTKLTIVHELLDYMKVFTKLPCDLNKA